MNQEFLNELKNKYPGTKFKLTGMYPTIIFHDNRYSQMSDGFLTTVSMLLNKYFDKEDRKNIFIAYDSLGKIKDLETQDNNYILCYVDGHKAFFTRQSLDDQWGDDWNDFPYYGNAGEPYSKNNNDIIKVYFDTEHDFVPPYIIDGPEYSVEQINNGDVPWIIYSTQRKVDGSYLTMIRAIFAGTTLDDFKRIILADEGEIYMKVKSE